MKCKLAPEERNCNGGCISIVSKLDEVNDNKEDVVIVCSSFLWQGKGHHHYGTKWKKNMIKKLKHRAVAFELKTDDMREKLIWQKVQKWFTDIIEKGWVIEK